MTKTKGRVEELLNDARLLIEGTFANPEIQSAVVDYGYSQMKLSRGGRMLAEVAHIAAAQESAQELDQKMKELDRWLGDYRVIVRIALVRSPQLLERVGLKG